MHTLYGMYRAPFIIILFAFLVNTLGPFPVVRAEDLGLPVPGMMVQLSPSFNPPVFKGITVSPRDPFKFNFILEKGDDPSNLDQESSKLVKYFLASITTPENDLWVNLSPYEKNRIIPDSFGRTDMGRDLLAEDYILKQITASLIYPEGETGKRFWRRVYQEAAKRYGTTDVPVNTFNKVWIVPGHARVYEHGNTAFVVQARLKVMLEQDYLSMSKHIKGGEADKIGTDIVRQIVIPELTREVNEGRNFASLRQVYSSLILAVWFKKHMKESILGRKYVDQNKVSGILRQQKAGGIEFIYQSYLKAFKKGVYNYIKEEPNPTTNEMIPRKYFSGGWVGAFKAEDIDFTKTIEPSEIPKSNFADVAVDLDSAQLSHSEQTWDYSKFASYRPLSRQDGTKIFLAQDGSGKFLKVYLEGYDGMGMAEIKNTAFLNGKGVAGIPKVLNWAKMSDGGIGILMQGIENAASMDKLLGTSSRRLARLTKAAEILEAAHEAGISHNDIKPQNIIVNNRGEVMVIDWGIANKIGEAQKLGNGLYKAPEEIKVDQSDVYSLGVTIYDLFLSELLEKTPVQAALRNLYRRMTLRDFNLRPMMKDVAVELGKLSRNAPVDAAILVSNQDALAKLGEIKEFLNKRYEFKKELPGNRPEFGAFIDQGGQAQIFTDNSAPAKNVYKLFLKKRGMNELTVLTYLKGVPGVPKVLDWDVMRNENIWIRMEGISNASSIVVPIKENVPDENIYYRFSDIWNEFSFSQCLNILAKVAKILEDVHKLGISHNDVKPPNIIVNKNGEVMLIDWDSATPFGNRPEYRTKIFDAPEEFKQDQSDVFSLQVTIKLILEAYPEIIQDVGDDLNLLLGQMGIEDPNQRPSMKEIASELSWLALKASLNPTIHPKSEPDLIKRINAYFTFTHEDNAQLSSIPKYAFSPGPLHNVGDLTSIVDRLKNNSIKTAYYPGIGSDYKAAFDITDADTIVGVERDIWALWARSSAFWGTANIQAKQEYDSEGRKRAVIGFDYRGKKRKLILYNEDINVLNAQKIPELKDGYDFLFLKGLPLSSYEHDFLAQSLSLLNEGGLILENNLEKGLNRIGESAANFSVIKRKSIGAFINSYKQVVNDLSIWQKTAPGGIDLTDRRMDLEVDRDKSAVSQSMDLNSLENIEINGLYIKNIEIKPLKNLPEMLGIPASIIHACQTN